MATRTANTPRAQWSCDDYSAAGGLTRVKVFLSDFCLIVVLCGLCRAGAVGGSLDLRIPAFFPLPSPLPQDWRW